MGFASLAAKIKDQKQKQTGKTNIVLVVNIIKNVNHASLIHFLEGGFK